MKRILLLLLALICSVEAVEYTYIDINPFHKDAQSIRGIVGKRDVEATLLFGKQAKGNLYENMQGKANELRPGVSMGTHLYFGPLFETDDQRITDDLKYITVFSRDGNITEVFGGLEPDRATPLSGSSEAVNTIWPRIVELRWYAPGVIGALGRLKSFEIKTQIHDKSVPEVLLFSEIPVVTYRFPGMGKYDWSVRCVFENGMGAWVEMGSVTNTH